MSICSYFSILLCFAGLVWSVRLLCRVRDWRLAFLPPIMILATIGQALVLLEHGGSPLTGFAHLAGAAGLLLSMVPFLLFFVLERIFKERNRAEEALRASEAKLATAFYASPDAIMITAFPENEVIEVNDSFTHITGFAREQAIGAKLDDLRLWVDPEKDAEVVAGLQRQGTVRDVEGIFRTRTGELRFGVGSAVLVELDGRPSILSVVRDVTDRKRAEEEREAFFRELKAKNAELERFTYTVSHDLKSPLFTVRGFLGLLEKDAAAGDAERLGEDVARIRAATDTMQRLLNELLELSRIGRMMNPPEEVALSELAHEAIELVNGRIAERGVKVDVAQGLPLVVGDRRRLLEVLQNLLDNAIKFIGDQSAPRVEIGQSTRGEETVCYVRDNGIGIEPRFHEKVFGLFDRLDPQVEGTGLGLALVKRILDVHGGRIWVESEGRGHGSTFCFTLPMKDAQVSEIAAAWQTRPQVEVAHRG